LDQHNVAHNSDDPTDVVESDTDAGLNDNVGQNELNDEISNDINMEVRTLLPILFRGAPDDDATEFLETITKLFYT